MPQLEENPRLFPISINMLPMVILSLGGDLSPAELQEIAVTEFLPGLETIKGVYHVGVEGQPGAGFSQPLS